MKKHLLFGLLAILTIFLTACADFDLSGVSDEDLERISEVAVVCNEPYIRFGTSCCMDQNNNGICDNDEGTDNNEPVREREFAECQGRGGICTTRSNCPVNSLSSSVFDCPEDQRCCVGTPKQCVQGACGDNEDCIDGYCYALTEFETEPTASNPITLQQQVEIGRNKEKTMSIGFYNRNPNTAMGAVFRINECLDGQGAPVSADKVPSISSTKYDVGPSSAKAYSIIAKENGLQAGTYICTMVVCNQDSCQQDIYETKQFFLWVIESEISSEFASTTAEYSVELRALGSMPRLLRVPMGAEVTFINMENEPRWIASNIHPIHSVYPESGIEKCGTSEESQIFDSCGGLEQGETFSFTFTNEGTWGYHDHLHPSMGGTIIVEAGSGQVCDTLLEDESKTYNIEGVNYVVFISEILYQDYEGGIDSVIFNVNGEHIVLIETESRPLQDSSTLDLRNVLSRDGIHSATFCLRRE